MNTSIKISEIKIGVKNCLENATELIQDADLLLKNRRFARTHSLTQLALEEVGKAMMLYEFYNALQMDNRKEFDFKKFRKNFYNHKWKTFESTMVNLMMYTEKESYNLKSDDFKKYALDHFEDILKVKSGHYDDLKNNSLYVSLKNNKFCKPTELFNEKDTLEFFNKSKRKVEFITNQTFKWLDIDQWLGADREGIVTRLQKELKK